MMDQLAEQAIAALREGDAEKAKTLLLEAVEENPERVDLMHALAVTHLRLGESEAALGVCSSCTAQAHLSAFASKYCTACKARGHTTKSSSGVRTSWGFN